MADPVDLEVDPGPETKLRSEPIPRGPVVGSGGQLQRAYFNWFEGRDRMLGEIVSGINRNRATIVSLATSTEGELGTLTAAVEVVAEVATDAEMAVATLSSEVVAARQGEPNLSAKVTQLATATSTVDGKLSASYSLTVDANGRIASLKLLSNGATSEVAFTTDTFKIFNGTSNEAIFGVSGGTVTINGDLILTGTFTRDRFASGEIPALTAEGLAANYYETGTDPGAVANGSLWFDTATSNLYIRRSGSWGLIANIAGNTLSLKRVSGDFVNVKIGAGTNNPGAVVFSASGGAGGYAYSHALLPQSPSTPVITLTSTTGDTTAVTATSSPTDEVRAAVVTTVTDSDGNTAQLTYPVYLAWET